MAPAPVVRRVSYVLPAPSEPRTRLVLPPIDAPRRGRTVPLVVPHSPSSPASSSASKKQLHRTSTSTKNSASNGAAPASSQPMHRLGVSAMAIDLSTHIASNTSPQGILYSAGRDGLVVAWELGAPTMPRRKPPADSTRNRVRKGDWMAMTGWDDDQDWSDEEEDAERDEFGALDTSGEDDFEARMRTDRGVYGSIGARSNRSAAVASPSSPRTQLDQTLPYERRWQIDSERAVDVQPHSSFRQSVQSHNDWINDILLCNLNQNVISASNDGTVKSWSPHHPSLSNSPETIGKHSDYVRCLTQSPHQNWVASGSFDRTIKLWDLSRSPSSAPSSTTANPASLNPTPITTLSLGDTSHKSSVYALASDGVGNLLASGSPERVVRLWDPRAGKKVGKLVGHTDNIRSVIVSEDGRYVLTGSSDASIKIWSVASSRCLHTFSHHTESVWALHSSHPTLSIFYSGDRAGLVCKVDVEDCADVGEGECVVVARDIPDSIGGEANGNGGAGMRSRGKEGISALVALDDWAVWTATGASDIKRWDDPGRRADRVKTNGTGTWDQFSSPGSPPPAMRADSGGVESWGFSRLNSSLSVGNTLSRSPTPVGGASMGMRRDDSKASSYSSTSGSFFITGAAHSGTSSPSLSPPIPLGRTDSGSGGEGSTPLISRTNSNTNPNASYSPSSPHTPSHGNISHPLPRSSLHHTRPSFSSSVAFVDEPVDIPAPSPPPGAKGTVVRSDETLFGIPFDSLVMLTSPNSGFGWGGGGGIVAGGFGAPRDRDPEVATLYSAASVMSVPVHSRPVGPVQTPGGGGGLSAALIRSSSNGELFSGNASVASIRHVAMPSPSLHDGQPGYPYQQQYGGQQHYHYQHPTPQAEYESRDSALDARPLRNAPAEVLHGSHGLVRSVILNDRVHALTVDTAGEVALWDLMRGVCRGYWTASDVERAAVPPPSSGHSNASSSVGGVMEWSPRESLETVRERIEGEAMIASWSSVETKMGSLSVHLAEMTVFDAEVYADEAGWFPDSSTFPEEHRINAGRWILYNLFSGFIHAESLTIPNTVPSGTSTPSTDSKGIHRSPAPNFINISSPTTEQPRTRRLRSNSELTVMAAQKTPGLPAAVSTPGMAPAVLPDVPPIPSIPESPRVGARFGMSLNLAKSPLPAIPASPASFQHTGVGSPTPRAGGLNMSNMAATPGTTAFGKPISSSDYFSPRLPSGKGDEDNVTSSNGDDMQTPAALSALKTPDASHPPSSAPPVTPGGRFMGRLKGLNFASKTPKKGPLSAEDVAHPVAIAEEEAEPVEESPTVRAAKLNFAFLDGLQTSSLAIPTALEAPRLILPEGTVVNITEQVSGENSWTTIYDGAVGATKDDVQILEATAPLWLLECLFVNKISQQSTVKVSFMVVPWNKGEGEPMPELMSSQARLNASRALRIRKVVLYVVEKLEHLALAKEQKEAAGASPPSSDPPATTSPGAAAAATPPASEAMRSLPSSPPVNARHHLAANEFEILCNDAVLPHNMTLAAVRHYVWRQSGELVLQYRKKVRHVETGVAL